MIAAATPLIATPLGLPAAAEPAPTRVDETAKNEFAAMLTAMMNPTKVVPVPTRRSLDEIADSTAAADVVDSDEETEPTGETTGTAATSVTEPTGTREANATAPTAAAAAAAGVVASTDGLDPEFSKRLDRVLDRMRDSGHTVEVRETLRTPERQDALYAQGRTTTGPVVTWTRDSRHIEGKAADVIVDGRASGKGYALLQQIAQEEGLRTLGARDPGHLELPRTTVDAREGAAARRGTADQVVRPLRQGGMLAMPAQVAKVAQVAQVAATARVAVPGERASAQFVGQGASRQGAIRSGDVAEVATVRPDGDRGMVFATADRIARIVSNDGASTGAGTGAITGASISANTGASISATASSTAVADTAARSVLARGATVVGSATEAKSSAPAAELRSVRGALIESDPILATVPTDGGGTASRDGATRDASRDASRDATPDASRDAGSDTRRDTSGDTAGSPRGQRTIGQQEARVASFARGSRTAGESTRDAERDIADARTVRQARARASATIAALAADVTSRSSFDPMSETTPVAGARMGNLGAMAPIMRTGGLAAERVAELLAARDAQPAGTLGELRLAMDPVRDGLSEVRLALQNGALDATLRTNDAGIARGLQSEVATLTRSLERQGFDAARVSVQLDAAQHARATALDTVAAAEASARARTLRGDSDASLEGREQQRAPDSGREQSRDQQREQQHARQFGTRRQRPF